MIRLETSLETPSFCKLALRPSMPLVLKFCLGQGDEFLPLDFFRYLSSRSIKLVVVWTFSLLLGTTVVVTRFEYNDHHRYFVFKDFAQNLWDHAKWGKYIKTLVEPILLEGIYCLTQWIWSPRKVSYDLMR